MQLLPRLWALFGFVAALACAAAPAKAQGQFDRPKYASIVVDANSGEVLYALRADQQRYPASITKVMTLYLTFEALATGRLSFDDRVPFSARAAAQAPSKLGVPAGRDISVNEAIQAAAVMSANDVALALGERIGGTEEKFAALMTLRAQELGMRNTRFVNAHGLPDSRQVTTARDIAILSRAVMRDYPQYYRFFNQRSFTWHGRTQLNHNRLLLSMPGMDGLKTGFTNAAGFNLAASAVRNGRRLITVVLGGSSSAARNENVENLLNAGFDVLDRRAHGQQITLASALNEPDDSSGPLMRPPYEMGSGEQAGLQVVLGRPVPNPPETALTAPMRIARADLPPPSPVRLAPAMRRSVEAAEVCDTVTIRRHGRRTHERRCRPGASQTQVAKASAPDCRRLRGAKLRACRGEARETVQVAKTDASDCRGLKGRKLKACHASEPAPAVQTVAKAELRDCAKAKGRKARAACRADADGSDGAKTAKASGGDYQVQVGAFGSRADAQQHLAKMNKSHGALFGGASEKVESAGKSFRARFAGLSKADAQAACKSLAAKGERCLVVR